MASRSEQTWEVDAVPEFTSWLRGLDPASQEKVVALRNLLARHGPALGRPYADRIKGSKRKNLKELRPSSSQDEALRVLFYFDPRRRALLLVGGDKSGNWTRWYDENIPIAEERIAKHEKKLAEQDAEAAQQSKTSQRSRQRPRKGRKP